jgi:hypothetical protein
MIDYNIFFWIISISLIIYLKFKLNNFKRDYEFYKKLFDSADKKQDEYFEIIWNIRTYYPEVLNDKRIGLNLKSKQKRVNETKQKFQ